MTTLQKTALAANLDLVGHIQYLATQYGWRHTWLGGSASSIYLRLTKWDADEEKGAEFVVRVSDHGNLPITRGNAPRFNFGYEDLEPDTDGEAIGGDECRLRDGYELEDVMADIGAALLSPIFE